jgi:hypothetical protein
MMCLEMTGEVENGEKQEEAEMHTGYSKLVSIPRDMVFQ